MNAGSCTHTLDFLTASGSGTGAVLAIYLVFVRVLCIWNAPNPLHDADIDRQTRHTQRERSTKRTVGRNESVWVCTKGHVYSQPHSYPFETCWTDFDRGGHLGPCVSLVTSVLQSRVFIHT